MTLHLFLQSLHKALADGESLTWQVTRHKDRLTMALIPNLGEADHVPEEAQAIRAALSMPLVFKDATLDELSESLCELLTDYGQARQRTTNAYEELMAALNDATASAKNAATKASEKKGKKAKAEKKDVKPEKQEKAAAQESETDKSSAAGGVLDF